MTKTNNPEINVEELMQRIRAEVIKRREASSRVESRMDDDFPRFDACVDNTYGDKLPAFTLNMPEWPLFAVQPALQLKADGKYHVNDLLCYHDQAFVNAAYRTLLRRSPDEGGYLHYLNMLRKGCAKVDILGRLRYSKEGRAAGIKMSGLAFPFLFQQVYRIPVLGRFVQTLSAIWHLSHIERSQRTFENNTILLIEQGQSHFSESFRTLNKSLVQLEQGIRHLQDFAAPREQQAAINKTAVKNFTRIQKSMEELQKAKAGQSAFEAEQVKTRSALDALQQDLQHALNAAKNLQDSKANQSSLDEVKHHFRQAIETRAERHELTALATHLVSLVEDRLRKEDLQPVEQLLDQLKQHVEKLNQSKATQSAFEAEQVKTQSALDALQQDIKHALNAAKNLQDSKVNQSSLDEVKHHFRQAIETHAERHELTALATHLVSLVEDRLRKEDLQPVEQLLDQLKQHVEKLNQSKAAQSAFEEEQDKTQSALDALQQDIKHALNAAKNLQDSKVNQSALDEALLLVKAQTHDIKRNLLDQERRLGLLLEEARKSLPKSISTEQIETMLTEDDHRLDAMYASFEDRFRGTRENIKHRQSIYLPIVLEVKAGTKGSPILDLGCGRGEWLEFLRAEGLTARGVDINRVFLDGCRELELDVVEQDVVEYLRTLKPNSIGAVTAFHLIEHLPLKKLIALMDETIRVLKPEGLVIVETPNPGNVLVASCNFYFDPTHQNPLPGPLTQFLLEARGFSGARFMPLHPYESPDRITERAPQVQSIFDQYFFGPQDYAFVAYKIKD
jgi:SAM-dependent methyltransferase